MAQRAREETLRHFGRSIQLFTPLYLANYCTNRCVYCGFSARRKIRRSMLVPEEVEAEAKIIAATGLRKILALTGDAPGKTGAAYLASCLRVLARHFSSVGIEVPSMTVEEYAMQVEAGADSMTMFQETYNRERYAELHPAGPKRDCLFRLDAPERAVLGGMRAVNLGPLLGLGDWRADVFLAGLHAAFLLKKYPQTEISMSLPRMRPHVEGGESAFIPQSVNERDLVQALTALRCYLPQMGITLSTREPAWLRDKLLPLGVTRVSAGVSTSVGGHSAGTADEEAKPQFDISDSRSVDEMARDLAKMGYQPVFADWLLPGAGRAELSPGLESALRC
jgi:2-iminoacetate synthase